MRKALHLTLGPALILVALAGSVAAQQTPSYRAPALGDRVRLRMGPPPERREGTLISITSDSLVVRFEGSDSATTVPWNRVYRLEVSRGRVPRRQNLAAGALAGAVVGYAVLCLSQPDDAGVAGRIGRNVGIGGAMGAATALLLPGRIRWQEAFYPGAPIPADVIASGDRLSRGGGVTVQWSAVPMDGGVDNDFGSGPAVRVSGHELVRRLPYVEAFYARTEGAEGGLLPRVQVMGVLAGRAARPRETGGVGVILAGGAGRLLVDPNERPPCADPVCELDPGPTYGRARLWTAVGNVGLIVGVLHRVAGRADVQLHVPISRKGDAAESGRSRVQLSVGVTARL